MLETLFIVFGSCVIVLGIEILTLLYEKNCKIICSLSNIDQYFASENDSDTLRKICAEMRWTAMKSVYKQEASIK